MRIERIICDRCGFEQQEDDYTDDAWDKRFKGDICKPCATQGEGAS